MSRLVKLTAAVALGIALIATSIHHAEARSRTAVAVGIGVLAGAAIVGAATAAPRRVVPSCVGYRDNAVYNERIGRLERADYWWSRYHACRGD